MTTEQLVGEHAPADRLSAGLSRLFRCAARLRSEVITGELDRHDMPTLGVLHRLVESGPLRAGALAERLSVDPSQVSRAVAALVRDGAVQRLADPGDGRATLLVATPAGLELAQRFARAKSAHIGSVIDDWDPVDAEAFTAGLERFAAGLEHALSSRSGQTPPRPPERAPRPAHQQAPTGLQDPDTTPAEPGATT